MYVHGFIRAHLSFVVACIQKLDVSLLRPIGWPLLALGKHNTILFLFYAWKTSLHLHHPRIHVYPFFSVFRSEGIVSSTNGHANGRRNFLLFEQLCLIDRPRVGKWHCVSSWPCHLRGRPLSITRRRFCSRTKSLEDRSCLRETRSFRSLASNLATPHRASLLFLLLFPRPSARASPPPRPSTSRET